MRSEQPPVVATWLLERFCADVALAGDLAEEYGERRSAAWYWKQAIVAVTVYPSSQILEHKWLAVRAIATGLAIWFVFNNALLKGVVQPWMDTPTLKTLYWIAMYALWMATGWVIARLHRPYQTAMVLAYVLWSAAASVPVVYPLVVGALDSPTVRVLLAWTVAARTVTLLSLMCGGVLSAYRDQAVATKRSRSSAPRIVAVGGQPHPVQPAHP